MCEKIVEYLGEIDIDVIKSEFGEIQTSDIILTDERKQHIIEKHPDDYMLFQKHCKDILENPDIILKDRKNENTILVIKHIEETNMNIIIKLAVTIDEKHTKNSVMTAYRVRDKNVKKLEKNNKVLYKNDEM